MGRGVEDAYPVGKAQDQGTGAAAVQVKGVVGAKLLEEQGRFGLGGAPLCEEPAVNGEEVEGSAVCRDSHGATGVAGALAPGPFGKFPVAQDAVEAPGGVEDLRGDVGAVRGIPWGEFLLTHYRRPAVPVEHQGVVAGYGRGDKAALAKAQPHHPPIFPLPRRRGLEGDGVDPHPEAVIPDKTRHTGTGDMAKAGDSLPRPGVYQDTLPRQDNPDGPEFQTGLFGPAREDAEIPIGA
jgi:hypothetical protein